MADCKWMQDEICVNDQCPMCTDYCPVANTPGVCRYEERPIDANALANRMQFLIRIHHRDAFDALNEIDNAPTIDPESLRPQGEWMDVYGGKYANPRYACTNCGEKALYAANEKQKLSKSCPNCGAKMYISEDIKR